MCSKNAMKASDLCSETSSCASASSPRQTDPPHGHFQPLLKVNIHNRYQTRGWVSARFLLQIICREASSEASDYLFFILLAPFQALSGFWALCPLLGDSRLVAFLCNCLCELFTQRFLIFYGDEVPGLQFFCTSELTVNNLLSFLHTRYCDKDSHYIYNYTMNQK